MILLVSFSGSDPPASEVLSSIACCEVIILTLLKSALASSQQCEEEHAKKLDPGWLLGLSWMCARCIIYRYIFYPLQEIINVYIIHIYIYICFLDLKFEIKNTAMKVGRCVYSSWIGCGWCKAGGICRRPHRFTRVDRQGQRGNDLIAYRKKWGEMFLMRFDLSWSMVCAICLYQNSHVDILTFPNDSNKCRYR